MLAKELYSRSVAKLKDKGIPDPDLDAALLLEYLFDIRKVDIFISERTLNTQELKVFENAIRRRCQNEPLSYIVSEKEFWSLPFRVSPDVLIPRPETEILVEEVLGLVDNKEMYQEDLLELGTGSGIIPVILALELTGSKVFTTDISVKASNIARENIKRHDVGDRVYMMHGDWFSHIQTGQRFDMIISNPPYVALNVRETLQPELDFEPAMALYAGEDGLDSYRKIIPESRSYLKNGGYIVLEIGYDQEVMIRNIFSETVGLELMHVRNDYSGLPRVVTGRAI